MKYQIFTSIPCVVKIKEDSFELDETNYLEIDDLTFPIYLYPLKKGYLPIIIKPPFFEDTCYHLIFENTTIIFPNFITLSDDEINLISTSGQKVSSLTGNPLKFIVSTKEKSYNYNIDYKLTSPELINLGGSCCVSAKMQNDDYLLLFDGKSFIELVGDIEIEKNSITAICKIKSSSKHGKQMVIDFNSNGIKVLSEDLVYLDGKPKIPKFVGAKNLAFLHAIMVKDFMLARTFLHDNLSKELTDEHFIKYFGDFDKVLPLSTTKFCLIYKNAPKRAFSLKNENGKIVDVN